jgi:UDP-galactose transporter B1
MARVKQATPLRRDPSSEFISREDRSPRNTKSNEINGVSHGSVAEALAPKQPNEAGFVQLLFAAGGIYGSLFDLPIIYKM